MILPATEARTLHAKPTQAVDILAFVGAQEISSLYFENRYYLAPAPGDENGYAMLLETLRRTRQIGIAYVVIQARQHLAAVVPQGQELILNTLRWASEACTGDDHQTDDEDLLAACSLTRRPPSIPHAGASRQDHRWPQREAFHADVTRDDGRSSAGRTAGRPGSAASRHLDDNDVEIDDCVAELLHRRAHRAHVNNSRNVPLARRRTCAVRPLARRRRCP